MSQRSTTIVTDDISTMWALGGVAALFASAIYRLGAQGLATIQSGLGPMQWCALVLLTASFVYGEGIRVLDRRWVPHLMERTRQLRREEGWVVRLFAPLYGLSLISAAGRDLWRAWAGTTAIISAVIVVKMLPAPWRGIVDFAVASALGWGLLAIIRRAPAALVSVPGDN